jgi:hypothetical protein
MLCSKRRSFGTVVVRLLPAVLLTCGAVWACVRITTWSALPGIDVDFCAETRRGQQMEEEDRLVTRRVMDKLWLGQELRAGRLTLLETAARLRAIDRRPPAFQWELFRATYPGASDEERHCREAIAFVRAGFVDEPEEIVTETVTRLEAELQRLLVRGEVHLPESDTVPVR